MNERAEKILQEYKQKYEFIKKVEKEIISTIEIINNCICHKGKLLVCGNGGSNSDADHIAGELLKGFHKKRPLSEKEKEKLAVFGEEGKILAQNTQGSIPIINLGTHTSLMTAVINDIGGEYIFSQQVMGFGMTEDVFIGITTSGNSKNILNAAMIAKMKGMKLIGLTGESGGKLKEFCDICICVPSKYTPDIQDMHTSVYHAICAAVEEQYWEI